MESQVSELNKAEFRRLFMEDKMWSVMKNLPDWLNNTWLSLSAFVGYSMTRTSVILNQVKREV